MFHQFAKIFFVGDHQVLIKKDFNKILEMPFILEQTTYFAHSDTMPVTETYFKYKADRDQAFEFYNRQMALLYLKEMIKLVK